MSQSQPAATMRQMADEIERLRSGGWIVGNGDDTQWRMWADGMPMWTPDIDRATQYHRREDAEAVHAEDEDAWTVRLYSDTKEQG